MSGPTIANLPDKIETRNDVVNLVKAIQQAGIIMHPDADPRDWIDFQTKEPTLGRAMADLVTSLMDQAWDLVGEDFYEITLVTTWVTMGEELNE